jgi:ABC-type transport system substrate-binding protein
MSTTAPHATPQAPAPGAPIGTVHVVDPHPLNWLFITWNTMEEPVRTDHDGHIVLALAEDAIWRDDGSFAVTVRTGARFQDGEPCTAHSIKQNFDEVQRWAAPHPPGTYLNFHPDTECVVEDERTFVFRFPEPDGLVMGKFRGFHIASTSFWHTHGFGYKKTGSGVARAFTEAWLRLPGPVVRW